MYDVITFGGATRDIFFKTTEGIIFPDPEDDQEKMLAFKYGQKIITDDASFSFGGGAFNSAVCFSKMGLKAAPCMNIGRDESAKSIKERLDECNIDSSLVTEDEGAHTALSMIIMDKKDHVAFLHRGANNSLRLSSSEKMKDTSWFYITSLTGKSADILEDIIKFAKENGIKIALNPGSTQLKRDHKKLKDFLKDIEILILNREEAESLVCSEEMCEVVSENKVLIWKLHKMGARRVIITEGEKGSYYGEDDMVNFEPAFKKDGGVIDTTGAGDAFGATFISGIIKGLDIPLTQKIAAINAAHVTQYIGAQEGLLTHGEIKNKLKPVKRV